MSLKGMLDLMERKMIFSTKVDARKAALLAFIAFLLSGFQCAIYGMLTVSIAAHFKISSSMIVFFDSFGLWGQILAMATGWFIISRTKAKNTLMLAAIFMIVGSIMSILAPNIYIYTSMSFLCNMAIGLILVSCNYMMMGALAEEERSGGRLSILNVFFSAGFTLSPVIVGFLINYLSWKAVFILIAVLFVLFVVILLLLNIQELIDFGKAEKLNAESKKKEKFLTLPLVLTTISLFLIVYVEQIMNYFNQPHMMQDLMFKVEIVGAIVTTYGFSQMFGRAVFGKFLLQRVKTHKYIIISAIAFAVFMVIFLHLSTIVPIVMLIICMGLVDSCIYPSLLGYGLDQVGRVSPAVTSFMVTIGSLGIPIGTAGCGLIGEHFGRYVAMYFGPVFLIIIAFLIFTVNKIHIAQAT
jgi:predicted MFS family arabinose efflux permease